MASAGWSTQQLAEFVAAVSAAETEAAAAIRAVERAAEALDADVAAIVGGGAVVAAVGYANGAAPVADLEAVEPGIRGTRLEVPGVGTCAAVAASLEHPRGAKLVVARPSPEGFTREESGLLRGMARVATLAMRMLRVRDEERALRRVATLVAEAAPPDEVFTAVAEEVGQVLPAADLTVIGRYECDGAVEFVAGWSRGGPGPLVGRRGELGGRNASTLVFERHEPVRVDHLPGDVTAITGSAYEAGIRSSAGAPINVEGQLWGVMIVASTHEAGLPVGIEHRLGEFTQLVATAIANTDARAALRTVADEQAALRRVATLVARGVPPAEIFGAVARETRRVLNVDHVELLRAENDGSLTAVAVDSARSVPNAVAVGGRHVPDPKGIILPALRTLRPARITASEADTRPVAKRLARRGQRGAVAAPIVVNGRPWGVMLAAWSEVQAMRPGTEERLAQFTELAATAVANTEAYAQLTASRARIVAAGDEARRRMERDLHDGAQQRLVALGLQLRAAQEAVPPDLDELAEELEGVAADLDHALEELREFARGIHPAVLAEGGLVPALRSLARRSAVPVDLDLRARGRLPAPIEVGAYYVVSEALANVAKHAAASAASVAVEVVDSLLRVTVRDDGVGGADFARGSGLLGLEDRVQALGGRISVQSPRGAGTSIEAELPLRAHPAAAPGGPAEDAPTVSTPP